MIIPQIINKNISLQDEIDKKFIKNLPKKLKDNFNKPIINLYESDWEYESSYFNFYSQTNSRNKLMPSVLDIQKSLNIEIPEFFIPYLNINILTESRINGLINGAMEFPNSDYHIPWMKAYFNGNIVFEGINFFDLNPADYLGQVWTDDTYTIMLHKTTVWGIDIQWDAPLDSNDASLGNVTLRMRNAQIMPFDDVLPFTSIYESNKSIQSNVNVPTGGNYYLYHPEREHILFTVLPFEIINLFEEQITVRGTEIVSSPYSETPNIAKTFDLHHCSFTVFGNMEVLYNNNWYLLLSKVKKWIFSSSILPNTNKYSNAKILGYLPCWDSKKFFFISPTDIYNYPEASPYVYTTKNPSISNYLLYDIYYTGVGPNLYGADTFAWETRHFVPTSNNYDGSRFTLEINSIIKTGPLPEPLYDLVKNTRNRVLTGNKNTYIFKNFEDNYKIDIKSRIILLSPAIVSTNTTINQINSNYKLTLLRQSFCWDDFDEFNNPLYTITCDTNIYSAFYATDNSDIGVQNYVGLYHFTDHLVSTTPVQVPLYEPEEVDIKNKIRIDLINPFCYQEEKRADKNAS